LRITGRKRGSVVIIQLDSLKKYCKVPTSGGGKMTNLNVETSNMGNAVRTDVWLPEPNLEIIFSLASEVGMDTNLLVDLTDDPVYNSGQRDAFFYYKGGSADGCVERLREKLRERFGFEKAVKIGVASF